MKLLVFLAIIGLVAWASVWKMRKSQAEAEAARRKAREQRRQQEKEAITPEDYKVWPVVIRPVKGEGSADAEAETEEPAMTAIEYEPPEQVAS